MRVRDKLAIMISEIRLSGYLVACSTKRKSYAQLCQLRNKTSLSYLSEKLLVQ